jgi:hypothetical protein
VALDAVRKQVVVYICSPLGIYLLCAPCLLVQVDEGSLGEAGKNWPRPDAPQLNTTIDKLGVRLQHLFDAVHVCRKDSKWKNIVLTDGQVTAW